MHCFASSLYCCTVGRAGKSRWGCARAIEQALIVSVRMMPRVCPLTSLTCKPLFLRQCDSLLLLHTNRPRSSSTSDPPL